MEKLVEFFIAMTVKSNFNYVVRNSYINKYAYYLNGNYYDDVGGTRALEIIDELKPRVLNSINSNDMFDLDEKLEKTKRLGVEKKGNVLNMLKKLPSISNINDLSYREEYKERYKLSKFDYYSDEEE